VATTRLILIPSAAEVPTSSGAAYLRVNARPALAFDDTTDESAYWTAVGWQELSGALTAVLSLVMASATSGAVRFQVAVEAVTAGDAVALASTTSFDTTNSGGATVPGTLILFQVSIALTNADSLAAADYLRVSVNRDADGTSGTDDATGDCYLLAVEIREA
jgi:hypothetical protein